MKDIIENRNRLGLLSKAKLAAISIRENGVLYFAYMAIGYVGTKLSDIASPTSCGVQSGYPA